MNSVTSRVDELLRDFPGRVRNLVDAQYAALAIMDASGKVSHFFYSGIDEQQRNKMGPLPQGKGLLGTLRLEGQSLRLARLSEHSDSVGFPEHHPVMISFLGVPIIRSGKNMGNLYLTNKLGAQEFTEKDQQIVEAMAEYVAIALENSTLYSNAHEERARLQATIESLPTGVVVTDGGDGAVILANPRASELLGCEFEDGYPLQKYKNEIKFRLPNGSLLSTDENPLVQAYYSGSEVKDLELVVENPDLSVRAVAIDVVPIRTDADVVIAFAAVIKDMTQFQEIESLKSEFLSMITHDLRGPLSTIQGLVRSLIDGGTDQGQFIPIMESVSEESDRMEELVDNLLDMARIESGSIPYDPEMCHMIDVVDDCMRAFKRSRFSESHQLDTFIEQNIPPVYADHSQITRVLNNLVSNSAKYSSIGTSIEIRVFKGDERKSDYLIVEVSDQGVGIPRTEMENVFTKFYRLSTSGSADRPGAGLGLAICRAIVREHKGDLTVESKVGKGSTFGFCLPLDKE